MVLWCNGLAHVPSKHIMADTNICTLRNRRSVFFMTGATRKYINLCVCHYEKHKGNFIQAINDTLPLLSENLNSIERLMDADKEINFSRDAVSLMNLNLVRAVDHMRFLTEYASRLLNAALAMEVNIAEGNKESHEVQNAELDWLNNNKTMFIGAYSLHTLS